MVLSQDWVYCTTLIITLLFLQTNNTLITAWVSVLVHNNTSLYQFMNLTNIECKHILYAVGSSTSCGQKVPWPIETCQFSQFIKGNGRKLANSLVPGPSQLISTCGCGRVCKLSSTLLKKLPFSMLFHLISARGTHPHQALATMLLEGLQWDKPLPH